MKSSKLVSRALLLSLAILIPAAPALGQATADKAVIYFGGSYNQAMVDNAETGFFGLDMFAGKMLNDNLCLGFFAGFDVVHHYKYTVPSAPDQGGGDYTEKLAVLPLQVKAKYYFTFSRMFQMNVSAGLGGYPTFARLGGRNVGGVTGNTIEYGGSIGVGFDYWFLLMNGVSFDFEYHMFHSPSDDLFKYWQGRGNYGIIKF